jgi:hypothetical protein
MFWNYRFLRNLTWSLMLLPWDFSDDGRRALVKIDPMILNLRYSNRFSRYLPSFIQPYNKAHLFDPFILQIRWLLHWLLKYFGLFFLKTVKSFFLYIIMLINVLFPNNILVEIWPSVYQGKKGVRFLMVFHSFFRRILFW